MGLFDSLFKSWGNDYPTGESASLVNNPPPSNTYTPPDISFMGPNWQAPTPTPIMMMDRGDNRTSVLNAEQNKVIGSKAPGSSVVAPVQQQSQSQQQQTNWSDQNQVWSAIQQYYQGWPQGAAINDFNSAQGGDINRLLQSRGLGQPKQQQVDPYAQVKSDISGSWDNYINSLNDQITDLQGQRTSQEGIITSQGQQGQNTLDSQKTQGLQDLDAQRGKVQDNQTKTLRDLSGNIKNSFMAGNIYLGSRGAGDSSAADQYSYALTKMGNKQRGDVMGQSANLLGEIDARESTLKNTYNTETNNLKLQVDQGIQGIAQWFSEAQNQVKQMQAQGQLNKGQDLASLSKDILNQAINKMNQVQEYAQTRKGQLDQWAMGVSKNIGELKTNMAGISQFSPNLPQGGQLTGTPSVDSQGNLFQPGYSSGYSEDETKKGLFR